MKRLFLILLIFISAKAFSQSSNVQTAANWYKSKDYAKAKEFIDLAAANEQTSNDPKMWYYRGQIYLNVYRDTAQLGKSEPDAAEKSAISFINSIKTDKGKMYSDDSYAQVWIAGVALYNKALEAYRNADYERANRFYTLIFDIFPLDKNNNLKRSNITEDALRKNLYFVSYKMKDYEKAKEYLQKLIDVKFNDPLIYIYMSRIYLEQNDTVKATQYIDQGRVAFDENMTLINEQKNLYIAQGKTNELIEKLSVTIDGGQESEILYYLRGALYEGIKNYDKAAEDLKKAIEIKPDYLVAYYELGNMYFGQAADMIKAMNALKANDEIDKARAKLDAKFKEAQPYLEKAMELNPKKTDDDMDLYRDTVKELKQLYARTNQTDKYNELNSQAEKK